MTIDADRAYNDAVDTIDRLRGLEPREVPLHIPGPLERWKADAEVDEAARRRADRELQQQKAEMADAVEIQQAEQQAQAETDWDTRFAQERAITLDIVGEVIGKVAADLRSEHDAKVAELTRLLEHERAARERDRDLGLERIKNQRMAHREKVTALEARVEAQQRELAVLGIKLHRTKAEAARRLEAEEVLTAMLRAVYERLLER
jgi:hypothetical protein